jgi:putative FmdB family regulatory protein
MPIYEFLCQQCGKGFVFSASISDYERKSTEGFQCPECGSSEVVRQMSSFQVKTTKKS